MLPSLTLSAGSAGKPLTPQILEKLFWLRSLAIVCQTVTILLVHFALHVPLPLPALFSLIIAETLVALATRWQASRRLSVTELEIALHLALDTCLLAALLFFSGGFTNPFVSLMLFYIALSASLLSAGLCFAIALLTILLYSLLVQFYIPLAPRSGHFIDVFDLHLTGMWVNYILSALLMAAFVTGLAKIARDRENKLARAREKMLQNEHLLLLGSLSAGIAHEINTPLSSIRMLLDEMEKSPENDPWVRQQIPVLRQQTEICIERIRELTHSSRHGNEADQEPPIPLAEFSESLIRRWSAMRPEISVQTQVSDSSNTEVKAPGILMQIIINLLNNAADASLENQCNSVIFHARTDGHHLTFDMDDFGRGLTQQQLEQAGKLISSSKKRGLGVGLMLSHATLDILGGTLILQPRSDGTRARVVIKLEPEND